MVLMIIKNVTYFGGSGGLPQKILRFWVPKNSVSPFENASKSGKFSRLRRARNLMAMYVLTYIEDSE